MKCPTCIEQGLKSTVRLPHYWVTTAMPSDSYYDENGDLHEHDPNSRTGTYNCSNGHQWTVSKKDECWCGWPKELKKIITEQIDKYGHVLEGLAKGVEK